jgi:hypothetical protein
MRPPRRRILTTTERDQLRAELGEGPLGVGASDVGVGDVWYQNPRDSNHDPVVTAQKRKRLQAILDAGSPHDETAAYRRARDKEIREIEEELRKDVVPAQHFHLKRADSKDYHKVVDTLVDQARNQRRRQLEDRLKNLRREREPDDPNAGKIVDLREDRRIVA